MDDPNKWWYLSSGGTQNLHEKAMEMIESLQAENAKLREALEKIKNYKRENYDYHGVKALFRMQDTAKQALASEDSHERD